jgi:hypothetical protein
MNYLRNFKIDEDRELRRLFIILSILMSFISMKAGYYLYSILFGVIFAIIATGVFETLRLAVIYMIIIRKKKKHRIMSISLYFVVALTCLFVAAISYHAQIIEMDKMTIANSLYQHEIDRRISAIKNEFAKQTQKKLEKIQNNIIYDQRMRAARPENEEYWNKRINDWKNQRDRMIVERDMFLNSNPYKNPEEWISKNAPITNVIFDAPLPKKTGGSFSIAQAIIEILGFLGVDNSSIVKKIIAAILSIVIEYGILVLVLFADDLATKYPKSDDDFSNGYDRIYNQIQQIFGEKNTEKFIDAAYSYYNEKNKIANTENFTNTLRPIRKFINHNLKPDEVAPFFEFLFNDHINSPKETVSD